MDRSSTLWVILDELGNRLAAESMLAQPGSDEGLIPAYSLIGEMIAATAEEPALRESLREIRARLDALLDQAQPFDAATVEALRQFAARWGQTLAALPATDPGGSPGTPAPTGDALLTVDVTGNRDLLGEFHAEAVDHLQQIEAALLELEHHADDAESINSIFRSFHTLKGIAGFLQLDPIHRLSHEVETVLDLARRHELQITADMVSLFLDCRDAVKVMVDQVGQALASGHNAQHAVSLQTLLGRCREAATRGEGSPATQAGTPAVVAEAPAAVTVAPTAEAPAAAETPVADSAPAVPGHPEAAPAPAAGNSPAAPAAAAAAPTGGDKNGAAVATTVRVNTEKLDSLMDVVGELVIVQSQLQENTRLQNGGDGTNLQRALAQLTRITKDLQYTSMGLRLVPLKNTFQKMERLARETARTCGKPIAFQSRGESTELDRTMVESIHDPLVHLVRNSIDHGIEDPEARKAAGKPEKGSVTINAYHHGGSIHIEISDDGRGIDSETVLAKARTLGLVREGESLSREEILRLLFAPGFSTAKKVTAISGRGVGLDVVTKNIDRLRGKVEIESQPGAGTTFRIKLPLTMAIIDGLVVRVGAERFILPTNSVLMTMRPSEDQCQRVLGRGELIHVRGRTLPLCRLHRAFGVPNAVQNPWEGLVAVIESAGRTTALLVDEILNKQEVVIKNLGPLLQSVQGVSGGTIMGDGTVALILDPSSFFKKAA